MNGDDSMQVFNELPNELLEKVLSCVPIECALRLALVCKRWHSLIMNANTMSRIVFAIRCQHIDDRLNEADVSQLKAINSEIYANGLRELSASDRKFANLLIESADINLIDDQHYFLWQRFGAHLNSLRFIDCVITDYELLKIIAKCVNLRELALNNNSHLVRNKRIYCTDLIEKVGKSLSGLERLDVSGGQSFKLCDALFVTIADHCCRLAVLDVSHSKLVFHSSIVKRYYFKSNNYWKKATEYAFTFVIILEFLSKFGSNVKHINLSHTNVCKEHLTQLLSCEQLIHLRRLTIRNCDQLNQNEIKDIEKMRPTLKIIY